MRLPRFLDRVRPRRPIEQVLNLEAREFFENPYRIYSKLRDEGPLHETTSGALLVVRHADVKACMTHPDLGNAPSRFSALAPVHRHRRVAADVAANIPPFQDRPAHIVTRRALSRAFSRRLSGVSAFLDLKAEEAVQSAPAHCDLINDISSPYCLDVMRHFIGLDGVSRNELKSFSAAFFHLFAPLTDAQTLEHANDGLSRFREVTIGIIEKRRVAASDDLLSYLIDVDIDGRRLTDLEISDLALLILADGVENVESAAATILILLDEDARDAVLSSATEEVIEEVLRLETPAQLVPRIARRDTEIAGVPLKSDMPVMLGLGSANRDPDIFSDPDAFLLTRDRSEVLTFGQGRHSCIGAPLARLMLAHLTKTLIQRNARLDKPDDIVHAHRFGHRWPRSVAVLFG